MCEELTTDTGSADIDRPESCERDYGDCQPQKNFNDRKISPVVNVRVSGMFRTAEERAEQVGKKRTEIHVAMLSAFPHKQRPRLKM